MKTPRQERDPKRCPAQMFGGRSTSWQCRNAPTRDGWCGVHHPDAEARRRAKSEAKYAAWRKERDAADARYKERSRRADAYDDLVAALRSIAGNTCCDRCQEAAKVAAAALKRAERKPGG